MLVIHEAEPRWSGWRVQLGISNVELGIEIEKDTACRARNLRVSRVSRVSARRISAEICAVCGRHGLYVRFGLIVFSRHKIIRSVWIRCKKNKRLQFVEKKATTIGMVTSGLPRSLNGKRARSPKRRKKNTYKTKHHS